MRVLVRTLTYPVVFGTGTAVLLAGWPYLPTGPIVLTVAAVLVITLERVQPFAKAWALDQGDGRVDALHLAGNLAVSQLSLLAFGAAHAAWAGAGWWPTTIPFWAQAVLALAIVDLGLYLIHRASHGVGWLWRLHAIHHSPRRVYWMNGQRRHLVHELIEGSPGSIVLFVLGAPTAVYAIAIAIVTLHLMFQHANIDYRLGPLRAIFAAAELHRWHHQRRWRDVQGNYAAVFSLWDHLFGTALPQRGDAPADVGMDDEPDLPADYLGQQRWPFRASRSSSAGSLDTPLQ